MSAERAFEQDEMDEEIEQEEQFISPDDILAEVGDDGDEPMDDEEDGDDADDLGAGTSTNNSVTSIAWSADGEMVSTGWMERSGYGGEVPTKLCFSDGIQKEMFSSQDQMIPLSGFGNVSPPHPLRTLD
ncbi:hypothetical protein H0H81_000510 [Sphagnurus paluster]|uniref:Uncharacterized protein n=1 Tax=Sphagnurus paluster TaxID=117069 RepID=A0A9P7GMQ7_9AGAR|nr:hypothetical protein H0H81_000510 [Sphagnurus paluster]